MNILEVSMHFSTNIYISMSYMPILCYVLSSVSHTFNKESRGSSLRGNPPGEWEVCDREEKTAKGVITVTRETAA